MDVELTGDISKLAGAFVCFKVGFIRICWDRSGRAVVGLGRNIFVNNWEIEYD